MSNLWQDLRYGARLLRREPAFACVAIATLALGIGANTAIFSVVNALLLKPLPYPDAGRLVMVWQDMRARGGPATEWATPGTVADLKASGLFHGLTAMQGWQPTLTGVGDPEPLVGEQVTHEYFDVLGRRPAAGRGFRAGDDVPNAPRVVVLSHAMWQRRFDGDPGIVGRSIALSGEPHEIVGVMPIGFRPAVIAAAELWRPRRLDLASPARGAVVLRLIARLQPDMTIERASSAAAVLARQLEVAHPEWNTGVGFNLVGLHEQVVGDIREGLVVLLGAVAFVLVIACANVANLLLARASGRRRELAVRLAIGAGRRRLVRQLMTESLLLAGLGGALGVLLGIWGVEGLLAIAPAGAPRIEEIRLDAAVLTFALGLTLVTGVVFGIVPAMQSSQADVTPSLKQSGNGSHGSRGHRTRRALIVLEVAVALVLLVGSGLLMRTLLRLQAFDLGFSPDRVVVGQVNPPRATYRSSKDLVAYYDRLHSRVAAIPGVETAALSSIVPLGGDSDMSILIEGRPLPKTDAETDAVWYRLVSPEYFRAMSIPIRLGRTFETGEAAPAIVVSDASARRFWGDGNPLGRRVRFSESSGAPWFTVVGVAGEVRMRGARGDSRSEVYLPYWQFPEAGTNVVLKAAGRPEALIGGLREAVRDVDPNIPVSGISLMSGIVAGSIEEPQFLAVLAGVFASLALVLAAVGIYGVISYAVSQRTPEIGVRMALGATRRDVFALVVREGISLTAAGVFTGMLASAVAGSGIRSLLFGVEPLDPVTFGTMTTALILTSLVACLVPAMRATRVDPMVAVRGE